MPLFEYICRACGHQFETLVVGAKPPACPKCKSEDLEKKASAFGVAGAGAWSSRTGCGTGGGGGGG